MEVRLSVRDDSCEVNNVNNGVLHEQDRIVVCSLKRAIGIAVSVGLLLVALIIAFTISLGGKPLTEEKHEQNKFLLPSGEEYPWQRSRLPDFVLPRHYTIQIHPNLTTLDVTGWVVIQFVVLRKTNFIVLHSQNLRVVEKWMKEDVKGNRSTKPLNISKLLEHPPSQQMYLELSRSELLPGKKYSLGIRFKANVSTERKGLYRSSYVNSQGERRYLATTHFEPTYARSVFPCFDEPEFKTTFKLTIIRNEQQKSLFNTPNKITEAVYYGYNLVLWRDEFQESAKMSTYLVAFAIGDFDNVSNRNGNGIKLAIYAPPGLTPQASFALSSAVQVMDYYDEFFGIPCALPKLDLVAIPDSGVEAKENFGLSIYQETSILCDGNESSSAAYQSVALVLARDLTHQCFGNLVTMKWWNDLIWLNHCIAGFVQYVSVNHIRPEWKIMEQFILEKTQPALAIDALVSSQPILVNVEDPREVEAISDSISYKKGAAIFRMLESLLGLDIFRLGLSDYLGKYKFANGNTSALWNALSTNTNDTVEIKTIMDTWTLQMGYPLIEVRCDNNTVKATQERFLLNPATNKTNIDLTPSQFNYKWYVPLTFVTNLEPTAMQMVWMNMTEHEFIMPTGAEWIKFNVNQTGFYRVHYQGMLWDSLVKTLLTNPSVFSPSDRANLIDDAFTLCRAGVVDASVPLELSKYLLKETDYVPWVTALRHFQSWIKILHERQAHRLLMQFVHTLIKPIYIKVGWADVGSHLMKLLRSEILGTAILCEDKEAVKEATTKFNNWMLKGSRVPPNLREVVYSAGVKYEGVVAWDHCLAQYNESPIPSEKKLLLKAMGSASNPWLLHQYLDATLNRGVIPSPDVQMMLETVAANPSGRLLAWRHLRAYWSTFQNQFGEGSSKVGSLLQAVLFQFSSKFDYAEVTSFFRDVDIGIGTRTLNQSLEMIRSNIRWLQNNENQLESWLRTHLSPSSATSRQNS